MAINRVIGERLREWIVPVASGEKIEAGELVCVRDGYAVKGSNTSGDVFAGIAKYTADNTNGDDGDIDIDILINIVVGDIDYTAPTEALIPKKAYVGGVNAVSVSGFVLMGRITSVDAAGEKVAVDTAWRE